MTPKQTKFCEEYLIDLNATQAAIRSGYSTKTAKQQASRLLSKVDISAAIAEAVSQQSARAKFTADSVFTELASIANKNPDAAGTECKYSDKNKALELLGKHLGMFTDKVELNTTGEPQVVLYWPDNGRDNTDGCQTQLPPEV